MEFEPSHAVSRSAGRPVVWDALAALVVVAVFGLLMAGAWRVGPTFDEHYYVASGYLYWATGDLSVNLEHPPLLKLLIGLPLVLSSDVVWSDRVPELIAFPRAWFFQMNGADLERNLFLARLAPCLLTSGLVAAVYLVARRLCSPRAALFALLALGLNPNLLAHGRLAALDGGLTLFLFLAVMAFAGLQLGFTWGRVLRAGCAFGLACLAKFTALVLVPFTGVIVLGAALRARSARALGALALAWLVALGVFAAGYGFEARSLAEVSVPPSNYLDLDENGEQVVFTQDWIDGLTRGVLGEERPVPLLTAWKGVDYQLARARGGHPSYFAGEVLEASDFAQGNPHPEYYVVVLLAKNPVLFTALALLGLACLLGPFARGRAHAAHSGWTVVHVVCVVALPLVLLFVFSSGRALLGIKYVLPVLPFLGLWIAAAVQRAPRLGAALCVLAALEGTVLLPEAEAAFPNELMYYNALAGGPAGGPELTVVGDDWGQDARTVGRFYARHAAAIEDAGGLWYDPYSRAAPAAFGLARSRRVHARPEGIVAVHAADLRRLRDRYGWLDEYEPFERIGWSVYVYDTRGGPPGRDPGFGD